MGAYYEAAFEEDSTRFDTEATNDGLKLMEHSYLYNEYCNSIEFKLLTNPKKLIWLCDYHEEDDITKLTWDNTTESKDIDMSDDFFEKNRFVINHDKKVFYERKKILEFHEKKYGKDEWCIHPLPILCNSEKFSSGGGDFHKEEPKRATWCGDIIEVSYDKPSGYKDISSEVLFSEY